MHNDLTKIAFTVRIGDMKNIFRYVSISLITSILVACSAAPPAQPDPTQTAEVPVPVVQPEPEPVKEPEKPIEPVKKTAPIPAAKLVPAKPVPQVKKQEAAPAAKMPEPVKKEDSPKEPVEPVKPAEEPAKSIEPEKAPEPAAPAKVPEPITETKPEPVEELKPVPANDANEIIAEFEGVQITKETYNQTKTEIEKVVDKLNRITATKDYNQWISFLSADYRQQYSQAKTLKMVSEALPVKGIKLKSLKDYFTYVFVPSRQNVRVDDIKFVSATRVDVIMKQGNVFLLIYRIENINGDWKLMPPKL